MTSEDNLVPRVLSYPPYGAGRSSVGNPVGRVGENPGNEVGLRNERRNSTLKTCHYAGLSSASDWLKQIFSRGTTSQKHYPDLRSDTSSDGISELVSLTSFRGKTSSEVTKCRFFSQAISLGIIRGQSREELSFYLVILRLI